MTGVVEQRASRPPADEQSSAGGGTESPAGVAPATDTAEAPAIVSPEDHWPDPPTNDVGAAPPAPVRRGWGARLSPAAGRLRSVGTRGRPAIGTVEAAGAAATAEDGVPAAATAVAVPAGDDVADAGDGKAEARTSPWWARRPGPRSLPALLGAAVMAVALVGVALFFLLPRAEVAVALKRRPVEAELVYEVVAPGAAPGRDAALTVEGEPVTLEIEFEASVATTGIRTEPGDTASGEVRLANPGAEEVTVAKGTVVATEEEVEFAFVEDVSVPARPPDAPAGYATGRVRAVRPGAGGNVEPGEIGGRLPNGVYYSNRDGPTAGGTEREIRVVAPEDVEKLRAEAEAALPDRAAERFAEELAENVAALPSTFAVGKGSDRFDHEAGDEAERLSLRAVRPVTALTYEPDATVARVRADLDERLAAGVPTGYAVDEERVVVDPPQPVAERADGARFRLAARGAAVAVLDEAERAALADELAGEEPAAVAEILGGVAEIERFDVAYRPGWLPDRMPSSAGRIAIEPEE